MEQLILKIKNKRKLPFLKELLKHMDFVEIVDISKTKPFRKKEILDGIEESVTQIKLHQQGKIKLNSIQQLFDEL